MSLHTWKNGNILKLLSHNTRDLVIKISPDNQFEIIEVSRNAKLDRQDRIKEAKEIACKLIDADYVDGLNVEINDKYMAGMYCDDIALYKYPYHCHINKTEVHGPVILINEIEGIAPEEVPILTNWWKENSHKEVPKYE